MKYCLEKINYYNISIQDNSMTNEELELRLIKLERQVELLMAIDKSILEAKNDKRSNKGISEKKYPGYLTE